MTPIRAAPCLFLFLILMVACGPSDGLPTRVNPALELERASSTSGITPTADPSIVPSPTPKPTPRPSPSATPVVAFRPPTPEADVVINLTSPAEGELVPNDSQLAVGGLVRIEAGQRVSVTLSSLGGSVLAESIAESDAIGAFQTKLAVPANVGGTVTLSAAVLDETGEVVAMDSQPLTLSVDVEGEKRYLTLFHPTSGGQAVSGYHLFFDGRTLFPENNVIRIAIRDASCQEELARQSYRLRGSGYWQGFVVVPRDLVGSACAVASYGEPSQPQYWREFQVPIDVLPRDDGEAVAVQIGNPPAGAEVSRGQTLLLYGTAWNAPRNIVRVSILLENGRVLNEGVAVADGFGYWEEALFIPASALGPAEITAAIGDEDGGPHASDQTYIEIIP